MAILPLRVQHGNGRRQLLIGKMMVADNHIYTETPCELHLFHGLDSAIDSNDELEPSCRSPGNALGGDSIALVIAVRDVEIHLVGEAAYERMQESHSRSAVHVIVSIHQYFLSFTDCAVKPFHSRVHILHQERVVEIVQTGPEEGPGLLESLHSPLYEQVGEHLVNAHLSAETLDLLRVSGFLYCPFALLYHCA